MSGRIVSDQGGVEASAAVARQHGAGVVEAGQSTSTSFQTLAGDGAGSTVNSGIAFAQNNKSILDTVNDTVNLLSRASVNNANDTSAIDRQTAASII